VISRDPGFDAGKADHAASVDAALEKVRGYAGEVFVLGGGTIYRQMLPHTEKMYLTRVHRTYKADAFFPEFNRDDWAVTEQNDITGDTQAGVDYSFINLMRKK
jgi:dihydrofolate reductase